MIPLTMEHLQMCKALVKVIKGTQESLGFKSHPLGWLGLASKWTTAAMRRTGPHIQYMYHIPWLCKFSPQKF